MFVIKVNFYNVSLMTSTEERMIMKSAASSMNMEWCHIRQQWENKLKILERY